MNNLSKITITALINASSKKTWDYYTLPEHITQWNFAHHSWHCPSASSDLQIGGIFYARMEAKDGSAGFDLKAIYTAIQIGKSFVYEFANRVVSVVFDEINNQTKVTITFDPETVNTLEMQQQGWQMILDNFKSYVES